MIPPGIPGYEEAGGADSPVDFLKKPGGDPALAAQYMRKAGYPSGKYTGSARILMVGDNQPPASKTGEAIQAALQKLGFKLNYRQVTHQTMLSKFCGVPKNQPGVCPNLAWGKDFFDAQSILDPTFNGKAIVPVNNSNYGQLDDPAVNAAIEKAKGLADAGGRAAGWAQVDKMVTEKAVIIPWLWDNDIELRSANVNGVTTKFNSTWALEWMSLK
jgi:peptide/nickel transport system substrate-binding protein